MGALFSRNKNSDGKKRTFKFWPSSHDQLNSSKGKGANSPVNISKSQPITSQQQQWTEVSLAPPSVLDSIEKDIVANIPVPPPRKHKSKTVKPVIEKIIIEKSSSKVESAEGGTPTKLIPVEEDIIIPKKEPVHICDGTHHHVTNVVNGKVIHDTIVTPKKNEKNEVIAKENAPIQQTPKKDEKERVIIRPKNFSTVSLPNFDELKVPSVNHKHSHNSKESKKKPKRHISVVSLPTHNKTTLSEATIARLENYMARCKSFGALPPKELLEKLQSQMDFSSDSEESWEGVDDWDLEILEYTGVKQSPLIPRSRVTFPQTITTTIRTTESSKQTDDAPNIMDIHQVPDDIHAVESILTSHAYPHAHGDVRVPTTIEEDDEFVKAVPQGIITLKKREGRRESIDDFFDSKAENPLVKFAELKPENSLGRRGSDGFFGSSDRENILKDLSKKTGSYYSQTMLESESNHTKMVQRRKSAGDALLHRIDSVEHYDDDKDHESKENSTISERSNSDTNKDSKRDSLNDNDDFVLVHKDTSRTATPENKSEVTEHSNLLKFLKSDIVSNEPTGVKHN